jgi:hypothetical protein
MAQLTCLRIGSDCGILWTGVEWKDSAPLVSCKISSISYVRFELAGDYTNDELLAVVSERGDSLTVATGLNEAMRPAGIMHRAAQ